MPDPAYPHPTVANPQLQVPPLPLAPNRLSVWFNAPDQQWNWSEGFNLNPPHADSGGVHGAIPSTPKAQDAIVTTPNPTFGRWGAPFNPTPGVLMTTGYFWPHNVPQPRNEAGFSLWAPASLVQGGADGHPIVLVVLLHETLSGKPTAGYIKPWPYPASSLALGLIPPNIHHASAQSVADAAADPNANYHLMIGYAMMPTSARPYPMTLQRAIELVGFAKNVVETEFPNNRKIQAVLAAGGSHGAGIAMLAPTLYPQVFHAGVGFAHPPDFTQALPMQEFYKWVTSHLGTQGEGSASVYDTLGIAFFGKHANARNEALSIPARFRAQSNAGGAAAYLQRPLYLVIGDEDVTDTGEDWLGLLGITTLGEVGTVTVPNADPSVKFHYSRADKLCHESFVVNGSFDGSYWLPDQNPGGPGEAPQTSTWPAIRYMISQALTASYVAAQLPVPAPPAGQANLNPFRGVYGEHIPAEWPASGSHPNLLQNLSPPPPAAPIWPRLGAGTRLGQPEGLKIFAPSGAGKSIYVGSADGVVTRFEIDPNSERLLTLAQSPDLGYGAWALDVGNFSSNTRVVVATEGRLSLLDGVSLNLVAQTILPNDPQLFRPQRLQIVQLDGTGDPEVLISTFGGALVAYRLAGGSFTLMARLEEPGIVDFVAAPELAGSHAFSAEAYPVPVYIASVRGHTVCVELFPMASNIRAQLLAATVGETGSAQDIEIVNWLGASHVMVTYGADGGSGDPYFNRFFSPASLDRAGSLGLIPGVPPVDDLVPPSGGIALEQGMQSGNAVFVILNGTKISVYNNAGSQLGEKDLSTFAPARMAVALEVGELHGNTSNSEVVVSTAAGKVVWFKMSELVAVGTNLSSLPAYQLTPGVSTGFERSNTALAATWGMTFAEGKLQVVDQSGMQFAVDPVTGVPELKQVFGVAGPHRSLDHVGLITVAPVPPSKVEMIAGVGQLAQAIKRTPNSGGSDSDYIAAIQNGYLLGRGGAAAAPFGNEVRFFWWNGDSGSDHDIVLGGKITNQAFEAPWDSVGNQGWQSRYRLRSNLNDAGRLELGDLQGLRLGDIRGTGSPDLVLSTAGGSVIALEASLDPSAAILAESNDFGWGGIALAVGNLDQTAPQSRDVVFGALYSPRRMPSAYSGNLEATLQVLHWSGGSSGSLSSNFSYSFPANQPGYPIVGWSGIAIADVIPTAGPNEYEGNELIVTSLDGHLLVFGVSGSNGNYSLSLIYKKGFIGALGGHNSIHVGDYAMNGTLQPGSDGKKEIFVAGSFGLRRFDLP